jgi:alkylation response protein AidB-like acyl-CoA dehydrogenase
MRQMREMVRDDLADWLRNAPMYNPDPRAAARALRPIIEAGADEAEATALIPENVIRAIADAGLFGLLVPKEFGGMEVDPETYIDVIEELSYADGSVGWVMMATTFCIAGASVWLGPSAIDAMLKSGQGYIAAGHIAPLGKAERVDGGYRISGTQQFGSGSQVSSWFLGCFVLQKNGKPELSADGKLQTIWAYAPRSRVRLRGNWDVMGLKATASYDFEFIDQVVTDDFVMLPAQRARRGGPVYDIPVTIGHVTWALGVAMRIMDEIKDLARHKRRQGRITLIDQSTFQLDFARALGGLEASRALVRSTFNTWYAEATKDGKASLPTRAHARLTGCWATETCANVGRFAQLAAGSEGLRNGPNNRIQRCFRDLQVGATHRHIDNNTAIDAATVFLGINKPDVEL